MKKKLLSVLLNFADDILYLLGLCLMAEGGFRIWEPVGYLILGGGLLCLGLLAGRK